MARRNGEQKTDLVINEGSVINPKPQTVGRKTFDHKGRQANLACSKRHFKSEAKRLCSDT